MLGKPQAPCTFPCVSLSTSAKTGAPQARRKAGGGQTTFARASAHTGGPVRTGALHSAQQVNEVIHPLTRRSKLDSSPTARLRQHPPPTLFTTHGRCHSVCRAQRAARNAGKVCGQGGKRCCEARRALRPSTPSIAQRPLPWTTASSPARAHPQSPRRRLRTRARGQTAFKSCGVLG